MKGNVPFTKVIINARQWEYFADSSQTSLNESLINKTRNNREINDVCWCVLYREDEFSLFLTDGVLKLSLRYETKLGWCKQVILRLNKNINMDI